MQKLLSNNYRVNLLIFTFPKLALFLEDDFLLLYYSFLHFSHVKFFLVYPNKIFFINYFRIIYGVLSNGLPKWVFCSKITSIFISLTYQNMPSGIKASFDIKNFRSTVSEISINTNNVFAQSIGMIILLLIYSYFKRIYTLNMGPKKEN